MATQTSKLKLIKPGLNDNADITVINGDMDKIDAAYGTVLNNHNSNVTKITNLSTTVDNLQTTVDTLNQSFVSVTYTPATVTSNADLAFTDYQGSTYHVDLGPIPMSTLTELYSLLDLRYQTL